VIDGAIQRRVASGEVELAVLEAGAQAPATIVLVHGYPDTKEMWEPLLARLAPRYHVVAYDVRGAGASTVPRGPSAYDSSCLADDLWAVIDAVAPGRRVHLVGHDWGGIAGWDFVGMPRVEERLASFTSIAGPSLDQVAKSLWDLARRGRGLEILRRVYRSWYVIPMCTPGVPSLTWRAVQLARRRSTARGYPTDALAETGIHSANLYRQNILLKPRQVPPPTAPVPVQLIVPTADRFISTGYYENAERYAPSLRRREVRASHWVPRTHPELISEWISEFVEEVESS
jgi:pimeloyl-ACP methyl ester carboxylesterase